MNTVKGAARQKSRRAEEREIQAIPNADCTNAFATFFFRARKTFVVPVAHFVWWKHSLSHTHIHPLCIELGSENVNCVLCVCVCVAVCAVSFRIYLTTRKPFFCSAHGHKFNFIFIPSTLLACSTCGVRLAFFVRCPFFSLLIPFSPMPCSCPWISSSVVLCIFSFCLSES